jgi:hypothetical protein
MMASLRSCEGEGRVRGPSCMAVWSFSEFSLTLRWVAATSWTLSTV